MLLGLSLWIMLPVRFRLNYRKHSLNLQYFIDEVVKIKVSFFKTTGK